MTLVADCRSLRLEHCPVTDSQHRINLELRTYECLFAPGENPRFSAAVVTGVPRRSISAEWRKTHMEKILI